MIEIDGSQKSGSGTILRQSVALAAILKQDLHIYNIRQNRPQPGLRPQHLEAVLTAAKLCDAEIKGAMLNSCELVFKPKRTRGGRYEAKIGTAGSIPMLMLTVLPICAFSEDTIHLSVSRGGTDVRHSPTINYIRHVLLPILERMGLNATLDVGTYGYYPKGMGEATLTVKPCTSLKALSLDDFGEIKRIEGISVCTYLEERKVAERQAVAANQFLSERGYATKIQLMNDRSNPIQKGSSLTLWAETDTGVILGGDAIGEISKPSETVGKEAAQNLLIDMSAAATADIHLADMLVPYISLAEGCSKYLTRAISDHLETNIWLAETMLNIQFHMEKTGTLYSISDPS